MENHRIENNKLKATDPNGDTAVLGVSLITVRSRGREFLEKDSSVNVSISAITEIDGREVGQKFGSGSYTMPFSEFLDKLRSTFSANPNADSFEIAKAVFAQAVIDANTPQAEPEA